jgi:hypothetical protein
MTITVSEDLNSTARSSFRFCATAKGDSDPERGGFGRTEQSALWSLAQQLGIHPATITATATIERVAVR